MNNIDNLLVDSFKQFISLKIRSADLRLKKTHLISLAKKDLKKLRFSSGGKS